MAGAVNTPCLKQSEKQNKMLISRSQHALVECLAIALGAILGLFWGLEQAMAWALGGLTLLGALTAQRLWSQRRPDRVGQSVLAKWLVIALGFSAVFNGWNEVPLAFLILGALAVNLASPTSAVIVAIYRRRN